MNLNPFTDSYFCPITYACGFVFTRIYEAYKPYSTGLLAQLTKCLIAETIGGIVGSHICKNVAGSLCQNLTGRVSVFITQSCAIPTIALCYSTTAKTSITAQMIILTERFLYYQVIPEETSFQLGSSIGLTVGELGGEWFGLILGGVVGLWITGGMHSIAETIDYRKGMTRYFLMAKCLEVIILKPPSSPLYLPLKILRNVSCSLSQSIAYNAPIINSFAGQMLRNGGLPPGSLLPFGIKLSATLACKNITDESSLFFAKRFEEIFPPSLFPQFITSMFNCLGASISKLEEWGIESIGEKVELITQKGMHSFCEYIKALEESEEIQKAEKNWLENFNASNTMKIALENETIALDDITPTLDNLKRAINDLIFKKHPLIYSSGKYAGVYAACQKASLSFAKELMHGIQDGEKMILGTELLNVFQVTALIDYIAVHIESYVFFTILNFNSFPCKTNKQEEIHFLKQVHRVCAKPYLDIATLSSVGKVLSKSLELSLDSFYLFTKIIQSLKEPEQLAFYRSPIVVTDDYWRWK